MYERLHSVWYSDRPVSGHTHPVCRHADVFEDVRAEQEAEVVLERVEGRAQGLPHGRICDVLECREVQLSSSMGGVRSQKVLMSR